MPQGGASALHTPHRLSRPYMAMARGFPYCHTAGEHAPGRRKRPPHSAPPLPPLHGNGEGFSILSHGGGTCPRAAQAPSTLRTASPAPTWQWRGVFHIATRRGNMPQGGASALHTPHRLSRPYIVGEAMARGSAWLCSSNAARKALTTSGSNWVPEQRCNSVRAASIGMGLR